MKQFTAVILAAGKGKRMKSFLPKALHSLAGYPLIYYALVKLSRLKKYVKQVIVVLGHEGKAVEREVKKHFPNVDFVYQKELTGTASAIKCVRKEVKHRNVLILCADTPLIQEKTIFSFISRHLRQRGAVSLISAQAQGENELGRVIRDNKGSIKAIREEIELSGKRASKEVNSGIYCFSREALFSSLDKITKNKKKQEYFLTDIIEILYKNGHKIGSYPLKDSSEILGINTQKDLYLAGQILRTRIIEAFVEKGVQIVDWRNT
ncbi:MAG: NTP transferase domain-containing protein, partial [Candidatus Omnitrophota bacterium]